ncbi:MAG TPA: hypothetical protein VER32_14220 [Pyrinomonadaceae bacterium]|nr:hypothetical protein [Pyrinomonadaceae bacterium]
MKNVLRLMTFTALVAASAITGFGQTAQPAASPAAAPAADNKAKCDELYGVWRENRNGDAAAQAKAYESGKSFLGQCQGHEYLSYVEKWVPKYEAALKSLTLNKTYTDSFQKKDWKGVVASGKQLTAADQENLPVFVTITYAGTQYAAANPTDESLNSDAIASARRAISLVEAGKADAFTAEQWKTIGFENKNELLAWLNYSIGYLNFKRNPGEAANYYVKALQTEAKLKRDAAAYNTLALAYQTAEYTPMAADYKANCAGKDLTDECKLKFDRMGLVVDRIIDAMARAVALADSNPATKAKKAEWMATLEGFYKFRHEDKTDGLNELIANIQSKPLLLPSMQTMPTPAATTTPAGTTVSNTTTPAATTTTNNNATAKPANNPPKPRN